MRAACAHLDLLGAISERLKKEAFRACQPALAGQGVQLFEQGGPPVGVGMGEGAASGGGGAVFLKNLDF